MQGKSSSRFRFIDYLRASIFLLLAVDHSVHAYATHWGNWHFVHDVDRSMIFDVFYMVSNSIIMPMLFFIFGLFVIPSFEHRGPVGYFKERLIRLGIPYVLGILFVTPLLQMTREKLDHGSDYSYFDYWMNTYFPHKISQSGPFWVLFAVFLYSTIVIALHKILPFLVKGLGKMVRFFVEKPCIGIGAILGTTVIIAGITDLIWGAPWWFRIWWIFGLQGSRFLLQAFYFLLGVGVAASGILHEKTTLDRITKPWGLYLGAAVLVGGAYISVSLNYFDTGAYDTEFRRALHETGSFFAALPILQDVGVLVLTRTTLFATFIGAEFLMLFSLAYRFMGQPSQILDSLARNTYAIFLIHEIPVLWLQYYFIGEPYPIPVKILIVFGVGVLGTWFIAEKVLRRIPFVKRVIG